MPATTDPIDAYQALIAKGELSPDPIQLESMLQLQLLHRELTAYSEQMGQTGFLARLGFRKKLSPPKGVYFWGGVGRGKSMLMDLFFEHSNVDDRKRVHFHAFMQEVQKRLHAFRQAQKSGEVPEKTDPIEALSKVIVGQAWLLCFDEFHVTDIADAMILGRLFEALFERGVVVVTTSNRHPQDLYKDGLQRELFLPFIDMLENQLHVRELDNGVDYRFEHMRNLDVYLSPLSPDNEQKLEASFRELMPKEEATSGGGGKETVLEVNGRLVTLHRTAGEIAFSNFPDLCEKPYGPGDYLAIASRFNTLLISAIPILGPHNRDSAKRFVTLIDALYEAKTKLICSAEAQPHELYTSGDGAFEFERTVSRLMEMQTPEYMALEHKSDPSG